MYWIRQYTLSTYIKQRYHQRSLIVVALVFVFCYILAGLSPSDSDKIAVELVISWLEWLFALTAIVIAWSLSHKKSHSTTHMIHSQWLSYQQIFIAHRWVGATILLYLCIVLCLGLLLMMVLGHEVVGVVLLPLYIWLKILFLYTIVFVFAHHSKAMIASVFWLSMYILFYSVWLIQSRAQWLHGIWYYSISALTYLSPQFVSLWQNTVHIDWVYANIFTIVMSYGIYIICMLVIGAQAYKNIRWK